MRTCASSAERGSSAAKVGREGEGARQGDPLLLAAGQLGRELVRGFGLADQPQEVDDTVVELVLACRGSSGRSRCLPRPSGSGTARTTGRRCRHSASRPGARRRHGRTGRSARRSGCRARRSHAAAWSCRSRRGRESRRTPPGRFEGDVLQGRERAVLLDQSLDPQVGTGVRLGAVLRHVNGTGRVPRRQGASRLPQGGARTLTSLRRRLGLVALGPFGEDLARSWPIFARSILTIAASALGG